MKLEALEVIILLKFPDESEQVAPVEFSPCPICSRKFAPDRLVSMPTGFLLISYESFRANGFSGTVPGKAYDNLRKAAQ